MRINIILDKLTKAPIERVKYVLDFIVKHPCAPVSGLEFVINGQSDKTQYFAQLYYSIAPQCPENEYVVPQDAALIAIQPRQFLQPFMQAYYTTSGTTVFSVQHQKSPNSSDFISGKSFAFDWIATIFYHLSRVEEYNLTPEGTDNIGLLRSDVMLIGKHNLHHVAVLDRLTEAIYLALGITPRQQPSAVRLTHDLDSLKLFGSPITLLRYMGGVARRTHTRHFFGEMARDYFRTMIGQQPDPADTFDYMLRENNNGVLYFGHGRHTDKDIFPAYSHPRMAQILAKSRAMGYQFGFHPGFGTWKDAHQWHKERTALEQWLGQEVEHTRQHFLRFSFPDTCDILEYEGIKTDSSLGFRDRLGFRCGTGVPYHLYNFHAERPYTWQEIPPVFMDIALLREANYNGEYVRKIYAEFLIENKYNGVITTLFHNTIFYEPDLARIPLRQLYDSLI